MLKITRMDKSGYPVKQGEAALSNKELVTSGLATCVGFYIYQDGLNMLTHVDARVNPNKLSTFIKENFDLEKPLEIVLGNAKKMESENEELIPSSSQVARNVCLTAIQLTFDLENKTTAQKKLTYLPKLRVASWELLGAIKVWSHPTLEVTNLVEKT
jgi:hypothetical protein